jgi:2'-5' RNA ligase
MRLFVALELSEAARERLWDWTVGAVGDDPALRPVAPASLHVTLAFLGERPASWPAEEAVAALAGRDAGPVRTAGVLWLARVLALAVVDDARLTDLHDELCAALDVLPEHRPFRPHVTLARLVGRRAPRTRDLPPPPRLDLDPGAVVLLRSHLGRGPASYEQLARAQVAPA